MDFLDYDSLNSDFFICSPTTSPRKGLMERVHAIQRNLMTNNQIRPVQFQQPINYDIDSPDSSRQHDDEDLGLNIEKGNWKRFKRCILIKKTEYFIK